MTTTLRQFMATFALGLLVAGAAWPGRTNQVIAALGTPVEASHASTSPADAPATVSDTQRRAITQSLGNLPLYFVENRDLPMLERLPSKDFSFTAALQWKGISDLITGGNMSALASSAQTAMIPPQLSGAASGGLEGLVGDALTGTLMAGLVGHAALAGATVSRKEATDRKHTAGHRRGVTCRMRSSCSPG